MSDILKILRSPAMAFYEYEADKGAILRESADEIERLRAEGAKLVDENTRLQEWKDAAIAQAEDMHEYVLAQEITRLKALLTEAAAELSVACHDQYPTRASYPDEMRRWKRDMDLVNRIREALGGD